VGERVLILAQDLIWADRLARAVTGAGGVPVRVSSQSALQADLASPASPAFVIVDLTAHTYDGLAAIGLASDAGAHVLAVGQHDDVPMRKQALAAGADRVLAYRKLFEDGPATVAAWMSRTAAGARTVG
jgi:ActR/RegA family two-component response regulator